MSAKNLIKIRALFRERDLFHLFLATCALRSPSRRETVKAVNPQRIVANYPTAVCNNLALETHNGFPFSKSYI